MGDMGDMGDMGGVGGAVTIEAAYVVVGGGSSGAVVAGRLAERGADVVLLEAGPDYGSVGDPRWAPELVDARQLATTHDWGYTAGRWTFERARVIGGCSSHNGAIAAVGHRRDYDAWGLPGWTGDDVEPLYRTVVERMRVRAYDRSDAVPFHEHCLVVAEAMGLHVASDLCDLDANASFGLETVNVVDGVRWNTAFAYLDPVRDRPNLRIVDHVLVDRIAEEAGGVTIHTVRDGEPLVVRAGTLVLSAGVYGTPAILQRSGIGDPDRLRAVGVTPVLDLPGVGANLHDHSMVIADRAIGPELQRHLDVAAATGFLPEEQTLGKFVSSLSLDGLYDIHAFPVCASNQTSMLHGRVGIEVACMTPRSRGRLDITSPNPQAAPSIDHGYCTDPEGHDLAVLREGLAFASEMLDHPVLASLLGDVVTDVSTDRAVLDAVAHYYHPVGTCAMGTHDAAVCDGRGRVRGLQHVVVADASLFHQIPRANTNLPAVMVGERIASWL
jgi:choline dehydrogenase